MLDPGSCLKAVPQRRVQAAAQAAIPFCDDQTARFGSFTPHLSVGQFGSREEVEAFLSGQAWESAMLRVEEVCLMRRTGAEDPFEVICKERLLSYGRRRHHVHCAACRACSDPGTVRGRTVGPLPCLCG
jgi:hypothetical protein